jgi:lactate dehydrogenase-like 2-hydroxyacid dehydrogenase
MVWTIFAAGLDVFEAETEIHPDPVRHERAFLLAHWGSTTDGDRAWMTAQAMDNLIAALKGEPIPCEYR